MSVWGAIILVVTAYVVVVLIVLCGRGAIRVNGAIGLRLPALMASEGAWEAGHRAAVAPATAGALVSTLFLSAAALMPGIRDIVVVPVLLALAGGVAWGAVAGSRAAADTPAGAQAELPEKPDPYSLSPDPPARQLASEHVTHSGGLVPAAIVSYLPVIVLVVVRLTASSLPRSIAVSSSAIGPEFQVPLDAAFWFVFTLALCCAIAVTAFVIFVGDDMPTVRGALGLGALGAFGALLVLQWIFDVHVASEPVSTPDFLVIVPPAILFGAVIGAVSAIRQAPPPRMSDASDSAGGPDDLGNGVDG